MFSSVAISQVTSETKSKQIKSTTQSPQTTSGIKLTSGTSSSAQTNSTGINMSNYIEYRDIVLNSLEKYDKTVIPQFDQNISEEENIDLIIQWAHQNPSLIKESKRNEIADLYNNRF